MPEATTGTSSDAPVGSSDQFLEWAALHRVGSLDLPELMRSRPPQEVADIAMGYCDLLFEGPTGSGEVVISVIRKDTGASEREARELLTQAVDAFCPNKARHLL